MKIKNNYLATVCTFIAFLLWTIAVSVIDVQAIGPNGSSVGFAALNKYFHNLTGENMTLYNITDVVGIIPFLFVFGFMILGLVQLIHRKSLLKVDRSILVLGGFYVVVLVFYVLFEKVVINYRPVLIDGNLEVSYPSSTTMLALCVIPTAIMQLNTRIKNTNLRKIVAYVLVALAVFMVVCRLISGVHWFTDIIGGILLSAGLVTLYSAVVRHFNN